MLFKERGVLFKIFFVNLVMSTQYVVLPLVELYISGNSLDGFVLDEFEFIYALVFYLATNLLHFLAWIFIGDKDIKNGKDIKVFYVFSIIVLFFVVFRDNVMLTSSYAGAIDAGTNGVYKFSLMFILFLLGYVYLQSNLYLRFFIIFLFLFWAVYSNDKNGLTVLLASVLLSINLNKIRSRLLFFWFAGFLVVFPLGSFLFSLYRAQGDISLLFGIMNRGVFTATDAGGPLKSILSLSDVRYMDFGQSVAISYVRWLPSWIWSNRPLDLSVRFAMTYIDNWRPGLGYGLSPVYESYVNFGLIGPFLYPLLTLAPIVFVVRLKRGSKWLSLLLLSYLFVAYRGPFSMPSFIVRYSLIFTFFYILCNAFTFVIKAERGSTPR